MWQRSWLTDFRYAACPNNVSHQCILNITCIYPLIDPEKWCAHLGYAHVSLADQNTDLQIRELEALVACGS